VSGEPLNTRTAGTDIKTSTRFTLLLVIRTQHYLWLDKGGNSSNSKIVPAELLPLMAKYTLLLLNL